MSTLQRTRLSRLQARLGRSLAAGLGGPWWQRSLSIIALLSGFLIGNYLTVHLSDGVGLRTNSALVSLAVCEVLVFLRKRLVTSPVPLTWRLIDNLRIGFVYAVVLEAFKVGS